MRILYPPAWLNHYHWLILGTLFIGLSVYCWILYHERRSALTLAYGIALTSIAVISTMFWLIQTEITGADPMWLFVIERAFWWPLVFACAVIVDIHAADFNGHKSMIARLHAYNERRKGNYANHSE